MPQSLAQVYLHIVFSTKNRTPIIHDDIRDPLYAYMGGGFRDLDCPAIAIGGMPDHVHILCTLGREATIAGLIRDTKTSTSKWLSEQDSRHAGATWQTGYGVFSIGASQVDTVTAYIRNQEEHHRTLSYQDEYRVLMKKYNLSYDERYVWD